MGHAVQAKSARELLYEPDDAHSVLSRFEFAFTGEAESVPNASTVTSRSEPRACLVLPKGEADVLDSERAI